MHIRKDKKTGEKKLVSRILLCIMLAVLSASTAIAAQSVIVTDVKYDGKTVKVSSLSSDPCEIIELAGITLKDEDKINLKDFHIGKGESTIKVLKAHNVTFCRKGHKDVTVKTSGIVLEALKDSGITLGKYDSTSPSLKAAINKDMKVKVFRSFPVTVEADGEKKTYEATADKTVGDLLKREGYKLNEYDELNYKKSKKLTGKMNIKISRVTYKEDIVTVAVSPSLKKEYTDDMYIGQSYVKTEGQKGERLDCYAHKYVDGVKKERIFLASVTVEKPVDKVIVYGTKYGSNAVAPGVKVISELAPKVKIELDENGKPKNYKKLIVGKATAYCGGGITATGQRAMPGRVAVNPRQIPYGTKMYIVSSDGRYLYGYCEASDTGGFARKGSATVDLYMHSYTDCIQFGRRSVEIYILE